MNNQTTLNDLFPSKYLKADDILGGEKVVTILEVDVKPVGFDNELKLVMTFVEFPGKEFVLNKTNAETIGKLYNNRPTAWANKQLTLFVMNVEYQGKITRGIRVRDAVPKPLPQTPRVLPDQEFNQVIPDEPEFDTSR